MEIKYFNREKNCIEQEKVYGDKAVKWLYESKMGKSLGNVLTCAPLSKLYGAMQSSSLISRRKIDPFIKEFNIPMEEYLPEEGGVDERPYSSFNSFFIRRFKEGARTFVEDPEVLPAFSEGRYFGYDRVLEDQRIPVKGKYLTPELLLDNAKWNSVFEEGPLLLSRLCPVDYHRFHFPVDGNILDHYRVEGKLHSVNPIALREKGDIFATNERQVTILDTPEFGKLAYVEVGAIMVGKIVQSYESNIFRRGDEKGYFLFGGSTVIVLGEKGKWVPENDILENTSKGMETYIKLGDRLAHSFKN